MRSTLQKVCLITSGAALGLMVSLTFSAFAEKDIRTQLPLDELRTFAEVFGRIKQDYVEPIEDKKLITEAINGQLGRAVLVLTVVEGKLKASRLFFH